MTQAADFELCPKGHHSTEADYCSECGARIAGSSPESSGAASAPAMAMPFQGESCPDCATVREQPEIAFCEVCGFNFQTGARGEIPMPPATLQTDPEPTAPSGDGEAQSEASDPDSPSPNIDSSQGSPAPHGTWVLQVEVAPEFSSAESPAPPEGFVPSEILLTEPVSLIGRVDVTRGIFPEVALTHDEAVSRRHALLQIEGETGRLLLRDIGASNGTRLNGTEIAAMSDHPLKDGDEITLGHWSRLRVQQR